MELKTYQGKSMADALEKVKKDLGRSAVILHTRTIKRGGVMGVGSRTLVEVTASRDPHLVSRATPGRIAPRREPPTGLAREPAAPNLPAARPEGALREISVSTAALRGEMNDLRGMVRQLLERSAAAGDTPPPDMPAELQEYYTKLIGSAVADELAREVIDKVRAQVGQWQDRLKVLGPAAATGFATLIQEAMAECIERMLPGTEPSAAVPGSREIIALIGPTGVGKTTTIAKLAAQCKLRERRRVALITTDTYRIAAVAQLRAYADILSLPLEVVYTPDELVATLARMADYDVILVDTSGRSQNDVERLDELKCFLDAARAHVADPQAGPASLAVHLVLSCTASEGQLFEVVERFTPLGVDRVAFTKLDEAVGLGVILNVAHRLDVRLSYLTTGQDVPDDIQVGHCRRIAEMILNGKISPAEPAGPSVASGRPARVNDLA